MYCPPYSISVLISILPYVPPSPSPPQSLPPCFVSYCPGSVIICGVLWQCAGLTETVLVQGVRQGPYSCTIQVFHNCIPDIPLGSALHLLYSVPTVFTRVYCSMVAWQQLTLGNHQMRRWSEISAQADLVYLAAHLLQPVLVTDGTYQQCLILVCVNATFGR